MQPDALKYPVIETERLVLRILSPDNAEDMYKNWASDPEVVKFLLWETHASVGQTRKFISDFSEEFKKSNPPANYIFAIHHKSDRQVIGTVGMHNINYTHLFGEAGYCIGKKWWGRGITAEALSAVIDFCFGQLGLNRIFATHFVSNPASGAVMRKAGMQFEGIMRKKHRGKMGFEDCAQYSILRTDRGFDAL